MFERATGHRPFDYQRRLAETNPDTLSVPTGCGKTQALIVSWLYQRLRDAAPRRLVYALPMRTLVEQTRDAALEIRDRLTIDPEALPIQVLMGGAAPTDWREYPERPQILIGTIDMLLSRALNRGFGENRFAWPVSFGLLNNDCRWVFDEVQLMGPARSTSAQLDGLRSKLGTELACETIWASATLESKQLQTIDRPSLRGSVELSPDDRSGPLAARLQAKKQLARLDLADQKGAPAAQALAGEVLRRHRPGERTIVIANTVSRAQEIVAKLQRELEGDDQPETVLLHSRFRPPDRDLQLQRTLAEPGEAGTIVIATQVIEAGVDTSASVMFTDVAPFSSIIQRLGRCNRYGELKTGEVIWLDRGAYEGRSAEGDAAPYRPDDMNAARSQLEQLEGLSVGPAELDLLKVFEHEESWQTLRRSDLLDLFDTSPDLSGMDVDVGRFIREDSNRSVPVFFRPIAVDGKAPIEAAEQPSPRREELVDAPISDLRKAVKGSDGRRAWSFDFLDGIWRPVGEYELVPGRALMLDCEEGGYDELGWNSSSPKVVPQVPPRGDAQSGQSGDRAGRQEAQGDDPDTIADGFQPLSDHLALAYANVLALLDTLAIAANGKRAAIGAAAALHDIGKAHFIFQDVLHAIASKDGRDDLEGTLLAKSPRYEGRYRRKHFRHELASAVVVHEIDGIQLNLDLAQKRLAAYLIAAHHGKVRLSIRPAPKEEAPHDAGARNRRFALGIYDGDQLPAVATPLVELPPTRLDLSSMELGANNSWSVAALSLRDDPDLGPFRLAFLEAMVRIADWRSGG